jgi:uroporphyrinogen decarboxylase
MSKDFIGKDLLFASLRHERTNKIPWVPFAGVHAGKLKGYNASEVLTDSCKLLESLLEVNKIYNPDGQPVVFDLQVEAEILGCELLWAEKSPPSVANHPLETRPEIPKALPEKNQGRLPLILEVMENMKQEVGERTALYGLVTGPLTLASHLRGTDLFLDTIDKPDFVTALLAFCAETAKRISEYYIEAGMDVIAIVDPVVSQVSPRHFQQFLSAPFKDIFYFLRQRGTFSSFFVCGDATKNLEVMCQTEPDSLSIDENIDMVAAKQITDNFNITIGGNIPLTTRMLLGTQQDNMKFVVDLVDKIDPYQNFILAPGCDMPYDVPVENTIGILEAVRDPQAAKRILINYKEAESLPDVEMPDYHRLARPLIEVFTIDSATCPACGYMAAIARRAAEQLSGKVDMVEHKIIEAENVARVKKLGIEHLPAILINGELKYSSVIPSLHDLLNEINKKL